MSRAVWLPDIRARGIREPAAGAIINDLELLQPKHALRVVVAEDAVRIGGAAQLPEFVEVVSGLSVGEQIATSGTFLLKSELLLEHEE